LQAKKEYESLSPSIKRVRDQLTKYGGQISKVPAISLNLLQILKLLKDEDKKLNKAPSNFGGVSAFSLDGGGITDRTMNNGAMGENLEYFIENKIIETLSAYALTD
jgi:hypothetical protein